MCVCSSATFYGKVSFPPLCSQRLPDTDRACRLLCSVCVCVCVWRAYAAGFREQHRKRQSSDRVGALKVKAALLILKVTVCLSRLALLFHPVVVWERSRPAFDFDCGISCRGLASGASGSGEQQGCMPWAVSSPCQRTGEMLLRGQ